MTEQQKPAAVDASLFTNLSGVTLIPRGFLIPKQPPENQWLLTRAMRDLTFQKPDNRFGSKWAKKEPPLRLYIESAEHLLVPKFWALDLLRGRGAPIINANEDGEPLGEAAKYRDDLPLFEDRRRPQQSAYRYAMEHLGRTGGAMLIMPVGTGKTNVALKVALDCGRKILWLTHRRNLLEQVAERIAEFAPGVRIGYLFADTYDVDNKDIVLATVQSVGQKNYSPSLFRQFGTVVVDEGHHGAAPLFVEAQHTVAAPRMLNITANDKRKDGLEEIIYHFFSRNRYVVQPTLPDGIKLHIRAVRIAQRSLTLEPDLCDSYFRKKRERELLALQREYRCDAARAEEIRLEQLRAKPDDISEKGYSVLCSSLGRIASYNALLVASIKKALVTPVADQFVDITLADMQDTAFAALHDRERATVLVHMTDTDERVPIDSVVDQSRLRRHMRQTERQVMVSCFHKAHVDSLARRLTRSGVPADMIGKYYGDCSPEERHAALRKRIVLLTYAMAEEGLDCPTANSLVVADPRGNSSLQTIGRILRDKMVREIMPLVVHFCHTWCSLDEGLFWARQRQFKVYPNSVHTINIGMPRGLRQATSTVSVDSQITLVASSLSPNGDDPVDDDDDADVENSSIGDAGDEQQASSAFDARLDEVGAISVVRGSRQVGAATAATENKTRKRKTADQKASLAERSASRKQARLDRRQTHLAHSVAAAVQGNVSAEENAAAAAAASDDDACLSDSLAPSQQ